MTQTQPMCSPMQAAIAPVRRRTSASSRPTSVKVTKESTMASGSRQVRERAAEQVEAAVPADFLGRYLHAREEMDRRVYERRAPGCRRRIRTRATTARIHQAAEEGLLDDRPRRGRSRRLPRRRPRAAAIRTPGAARGCRARASRSTSAAWWRRRSRSRAANCRRNAGAASRSPSLRARAAVAAASRAGRRPAAGAARAGSRFDGTASPARAHGPRSTPARRARPRRSACRR